MSTRSTPDEDETSESGRDDRHRPEESRLAEDGDEEDSEPEEEIIHTPDSIQEKINKFCQTLKSSVDATVQRQKNLQSEKFNQFVKIFSLENLLVSTLLDSVVNLGDVQTFSCLFRFCPEFLTEILVKYSNSAVSLTSVQDQITDILLTYADNLTSLGLWHKATIYRTQVKNLSQNSRVCELLNLDPNQNMYQFDQIKTDMFVVSESVKNNSLSQLQIDLARQSFNKASSNLDNKIIGRKSKDLDFTRNWNTAADSTSTGVLGNLANKLPNEYSPMAPLLQNLPSSYFQTPYYRKKMVKDVTSLICIICMRNIKELTFICGFCGCYSCQSCQDEFDECVNCEMAIFS